MRKTKHPEHGFTLVEMMIVIVIMGVLTAMAITQSFGTMESYRVNSAMDTVVSQLRVARQLALSQRRMVTVTFNSATMPNSITYQVQPQLNSGEAPQAAVTVIINPQAQFTGVTGESDTPMGFGTCGTSFGVCIGGVSGGPTTMQFNSMGQFTDSTGVNPLNGTVFLAIPNISGSLVTARAVTILGSTGRTRTYTYIGGTSVWME